MESTGIFKFAKVSHPFAKIKKHGPPIVSHLVSVELKVVVRAGVVAVLVVIDLPERGRARVIASFGLVGPRAGRAPV
jgi:hypothetical protein